MSCKYYNDNNCSCSGCKHFIKSLKVSYEKNVLTIFLPEIILHNHEKICLCIAQSIPDQIDADTLVSIQIGDADPMIAITKLGNLLYADVLKSRKIYPLMAATDTSAFVLMDLCKIGKTKHIFPIITSAKPSKLYSFTDSKNKKKEG